MVEYFVTVKEIAEYMCRNKELENPMMITESGIRSSKWLRMHLAPIVGKILRGERIKIQQNTAAITVEPQYLLCLEGRMWYAD